MKIDFWSNSRMSEFWGYVKMLLEGVSPGILLVVALASVGLLLGIVVRAWKQSSKDDDDNDDIEFRHY